MYAFASRFAGRLTETGTLHLVYGSRTNYDMITMIALLLGERAAEHTGDDDARRPIKKKIAPQTTKAGNDSSIFNGAKRTRRLRHSILSHEVHETKSLKSHLRIYFHKFRIETSCRCTTESQTAFSGYIAGWLSVQTAEIR